MTIDAYQGDEALMHSLGLRTTDFGREWTDLGTVVVQPAEPGRPAAKVKVEVAAWPAQFWRFTSSRPQDNAEGVYEPVEIHIITTGSGSFTEYWSVAEMVANNMLGIEEG